ncbi:MAG: UbiA prenyltransferase family protein [Candidatus Woesearchaeota archaeon]
MKKLLLFIKSFRIQQYYKNLVIFIPLIFAQQLFIIEKLEKIIFGFLILCALSSANYLINDVVDFKKDRHHPEKRKRPIASGLISRTEAILVAFLIIALSFYFSYKLSIMFFYSILLLFVFSTTYTLWLKNEIFADIITISMNFVIRTISGAYVINVEISPWLIICTFFLAMFLVVGKREANLKILKRDAHNYNPTLKEYNHNITKLISIISVTSLIISYSLYTFLSINKNLIITLPISIYLVLYYFYLIEKGSPIARNPELVFKNKKILISLLIWLILVFLCLYANFKIPLLR